jgi:hypothetical protein
MLKVSSFMAISGGGSPNLRQARLGSAARRRRRRQADLPSLLRRKYDVRTLTLVGSLRIEWDPGKAEANRKKHGVTFEDAQTVFSDERARLINDPDHSEEEDRFLLLGLSSSLRLLVVSHCYRVAGNVIRIISARKATREEERFYP